MIIGQRVAKVLKDSKTKNVEFARMMGTSHQYVTQIKKAEEGLGFNVIETILKNFKNVNARWLILGHGSPYNDYANIVSEPMVEYGKPNTESIESLKKQINIKDDQINKLLAIIANNSK